MTRRSLEVLASVCLLFIGCAHLGCGSDASEPGTRWSTPYVAMGAQARAARPVGGTLDTPVSLTQYRNYCSGPDDGSGQDCEEEFRDLPAEVVSYSCDGLELSVVIEPGPEQNRFLFLITSEVAGQCELKVVLRDLATGETHEGSVTVGFATPERLAVEHRVAADPGLHFPVLVGAAFTVHPSVYAASEFNGQRGLFYPLDAWEVELIGPAFECGCADRWVPCEVTTSSDASMNYRIVIRAATVGTSTLIVRVGDLERVLTLEAVEESAVVDMELYRPVTVLGLIDADEDPLGRFEPVTEIEGPAGEYLEHLSLLVLADGRRAWGGAGAYTTPSQYLHLSRPANASCPEVPGEALSWMNAVGYSVEETTVSAALGGAEASFPVSILPSALSGP